MSKEKVIDTVDENDEKKEWSIEEAIKESREFVADFVLFDVEKDKPLFISQQPTMNEDGSLTIVTVSDPEDTTAVIHTLFAGRFNNKGENVDVEGNSIKMEMPEIITGDEGIVGLDGEKLTK